MVLADSRRPSRNRRYLGALKGGQYVSCTGPLPSAAGLSRAVPLHTDFVTPRPIWCSVNEVPQPRTGNATRLFHQFGLGYSRFARRYSGSRCCFPFLRVLRCFSSPRSTDQGLLGGSPWLFAASHVLLRCSAPRHSPLALRSLGISILSFEKTKSVASHKFTLG